MNITSTRIPEVLIIEPRVFADQRGMVCEAFHQERYAALGVAEPFVQDNFSRSAHGVLRGLHFQNPRSQGKLIVVPRGRILDVAVDVRRGSPTFAQHVAVELSDQNQRQMWVPRGFAHGFLVLSDQADCYYKCDEYYSPADECAIRWDDPAIGIDWGTDAPTLSARDATAPVLADIRTLPAYKTPPHGCGDDGHEAD